MELHEPPCPGQLSCFLENVNSCISLFMKTIVIANQKGGSGKSTVTVHLAAAAEIAGDGPVVISDTDPQGTAADWFNQRKKAGHRYPALFAPRPRRPAREDQALDAAGASYLFIDTAPFDRRRQRRPVRAGRSDPDPAQPDAGGPARPGQGPAARPAVRQAVPVRAVARAPQFAEQRRRGASRSMPSASC